MDKDLSSDDSLPKRPQPPELSHSKTRTQELFQVSHAGAGSQGFGPSSTAFPGHNRELDGKRGHPELELASIWDPSVCKARTFKDYTIVPGPKCAFVLFIYQYLL